MAGISAADAAASGVDCSCLAMGTPCPSGAAGHCAKMASNIASMIKGIMQAMSGGKTKGAVQETDTGLADINTSAPGNTKAPKVARILSETFADQCSKPNPPKYLCTPRGFEDALNDMDKYKQLVDNGVVTASPDELEEFTSAQSGLSALANGDFGAVLSADGTNFSDYSSASAGRSSGGSGNTGTGGSVNWSATGRSSFGSAGPGGNALVGPVGAKVDMTQWNGMLDAIDPKTGKSLTMWERATRRYMGTPDGQRGFTLARIESLRKQSIQKLSSDAEDLKNKDKKQVAHSEEEEETPYRPVVISPKEYTKH